MTLTETIKSLKQMLVYKKLQTSQIIYLKLSNKF